MRGKKTNSPLKYVKPEPEEKVFFTCKSWAWARIAAGFLFGGMVVSVGRSSVTWVLAGAIIWAVFVWIGVKNLFWPAPVAAVTKQGIKIKKRLFTWASLGGVCFLWKYYRNTPSGCSSEEVLVLGKNNLFSLIRLSEADQKNLIGLLKRWGINVVVQEKVHIPFLRYFLGGEDLSIQSCGERIRRFFTRHK